MSELINTHDNRATIRWKLLTGASAIALIASSPAAFAGDSHPLIWIELGADADIINGTGDNFSAPFLQVTPIPDPFKNGSPVDIQRPPRYTIGGDGKISFQPENSSWDFSAGIRYGRSNNRRSVHHQTQLSHAFYNPQYIVRSYYPSLDIPRYFTRYQQQFAQTDVTHSEHHLILDFQVGKDVGLGIFGHDSTSVFSAGVRVARFNTGNDVKIRAKPGVDFYTVPVFGFPFPATRWSTYYLHGHAERSFSGIGPSLSWSASAPIAGNVQEGQLSFDWGINGALLFGRQKAKTSHHTTGREMKLKYHHYFTTPGGRTQHDHYQQLITPVTGARTGSRNVTVPNLGANIGISYRINDAKLSLGYRADYFFGAMDGGIDAAKKTTLGFNGLYASISIGLGD